MLGTHPVQVQSAAHRGLASYERDTSNPTAPQSRAAVSPADPAPMIRKIVVAYAMGEIVYERSRLLQAKPESRKIALPISTRSPE